MSDETIKSVRTEMHAMHSPRKVKHIVSSHKKGTALETTSNRLSVLTRKGPFLKKQIVSSHKKGTVP